MKKVLLLILPLTLSTILTFGDCFSINKPIHEEEFGESQQLSENDFIDEPTFEPRFLPMFGEENGNNSVGKVVEALQSIGNKSIQENLSNAASGLALKLFKGDETVQKLIEVIKNPGNRTILEHLLEIAGDLAVKKSGGDEAVRRAIEVFKSPDTETLQQNLFNLAIDIALKKFGEDELFKKVVNLIRNPQNQTLQANILSVTAELALRASKGDGLVRKVIDVFENPKNQSLQENLLDLATEVAIGKLGVDPALRRVFEVIKNPGKKSFQDNLLDIALDVALNKAGADETLRIIARNLLIPGNNSLHQTLTNLASELAAQKGNKVIGNVLGQLLGNDSTVAVAKQKVGAVGQALQIGGSFFGGFLSKIGGNNTLGKIGQAITKGSQTVGGMMNNFAGNGTKLEEEHSTLINEFEVKTAKIEEALKQSSEVGTDLSEGEFAEFGQTVNNDKNKFEKEKVVSYYEKDSQKDEPVDSYLNNESTGKKEVGAITAASEQDERPDHNHSGSVGENLGDLSETTKIETELPNKFQLDDSVRVAENLVSNRVVQFEDDKNIVNNQNLTFVGAQNFEKNGRNENGYETIKRTFVPEFMPQNAMTTEEGERHTNKEEIRTPYSKIPTEVQNSEEKLTNNMMNSYENAEGNENLNFLNSHKQEFNLSVSNSVVAGNGAYSKPADSFYLDGTLGGSIPQFGKYVQPREDNQFGEEGSLEYPQTFKSLEVTTVKIQMS